MILSDTREAGTFQISSFIFFPFDYQIPTTFSWNQCHVFPLTSSKVHSCSWEMLNTPGYSFLRGLCIVKPMISPKPHQVSFVENNFSSKKIRFFYLISNFFPTKGIIDSRFNQSYRFIAQVFSSNNTLPTPILGMFCSQWGKSAYIHI